MQAAKEAASLLGRDWGGGGGLEKRALGILGIKESPSAHPPREVSWVQKQGQGGRKLFSQWEPLERRHLSLVKNPKGSGLILAPLSVGNPVPSWMSC